MCNNNDKRGIKRYEGMIDGCTKNKNQLQLATIIIYFEKNRLDTKVVFPG